jgi:chitodextrinase
MRFLPAAAILLTGCAYIGDPLPPSLKIPEAVSDVRAVQKGDRILVEFTPPAATTDGVPLGAQAHSVVLIGEAGAEPETEASRSIDARPWIGKEVVIGVRTRGPSGRWSAWSNFVTMPVRPPLEVPAALRAASAPEGIALTWESAAPQHRIYRDGELLAETGAPSYFDTTAELGRAYEYAVEAVDGPAVSERRATVRAAREDRFPPEPPTGLTALAGVISIELAWDASTAPDLAFYRVYRNGELIAREVGPAAYSDTSVQRGVSYRYAVSAVDRNGNESAPSATVEVTLP